MQGIGAPHSRALWERFVHGRTPTSGEVHLLGTYEALASLHERVYLERLDIRHRLLLEPYALPSLPPGLLERQGLSKASRGVSERRRREQSDVLVPLFPLLVELAQLRKQAAERLIKEFRRQREYVLANAIEPPYQFQYTDRHVSLTSDASARPEVKLREKDVPHAYTLWDRISWLKAHPHRYDRNAHRKPRLRSNACA